MSEYRDEGLKNFKAGSLTNINRKFKHIHLVLNGLAGSSLILHIIQTIHGINLKIA